MKDILIKRGSTLFLKGTLLGMGIIVLALCVFVLPALWKGGPAEYPHLTSIFELIVIGVYATTIPFFIALWQILKLLMYIDKNMAFSDLSLKALKRIKHCALLIGIIYMTGLPLLYPIAEADDAPGILLFGFVIACAPIAVAVFAAVLHRLLQNAIDIQSENSLTV